ncbi:phenylalanine--tRNA ligase subunit beta [Gammaproteobacteria bacterium]|nr:phenylalanine--tRNA ligase subunit beta [Gammaproteobacteria bacterium]
MKIQYSFLKDYLSTDLSQPKLADVFTKVGFECESIGSIIDFDITPNRGDVLSLRGLQREFHAQQSKAFKDKSKFEKLTFQKDKTIINTIDKSGCSNYQLMLLRGLHSVKALDKKKRNFLLAAGVPLIHPLVDLGNYVMLEMGTPMHVFDLDHLELPLNIGFPASKKNSFQVIGGDTKIVEASSLTIQDQKGIQAIAGIIGGHESSVSKSTKDVAVEAAFFNPDTIANQARKYGLATDASHRFERGVDPVLQQKALARFLFLLKEVAQYDSIECYEGSSVKLKPRAISLNVERFNNFSGLSLSGKKIRLFLETLGFTSIPTKTDHLKFHIPSHRFDMELEEDLYEEILRCYGYDNIPINPPKSGPVARATDYPASEKLKGGLVFGGFQELMHMPFVSTETFNALNSNDWSPAKLSNPINENEPLMRGSLFGSLFSAVNLNVKKGYSAMKFFEHGNVFCKIKNGFAQESNITGLIYFHESQKTWSDKSLQYDFYSLKAEVLKLLETLRVKSIQLVPNSSSTIFTANAMDIFAGKKKIGMLGEINPTATQKLIKNPAFGFEIYPERISTKSSTQKLKPVSKFPSSSRDLNILINQSYSYAEIETVLLNSKIQFLQSLGLANTFEGKGIPDGSISMTLRFMFQSSVKSLKDSEINTSMDKAFHLLNKAFKVKIRS